MATRMAQPKLKLVDSTHPRAQRVALLEALHKISLAYAVGNKSEECEGRRRVA